jgi:hypothetical protein
VRVGVLVTAAALSLVTGCVAPAPTTADFESKAAMPAEAAVSELRTALLAEDACARSRLTVAYLETVLVDSEEALGSVQHTFDSVQPPDTAAADDLRSTLDPLLEDAASGLTDLRIAARRDDTGQLESIAGDLSGVADQLEAFGKKHAA